MENQETIGQRIKARREERGLSLSALADLAKVSRGYLSQIESGDVENPSAAVLFRIAKNLGTSVAKLLGEVQEPGTEGQENEPLDPILLQFAREEALTEDDIRMLSGIKRRGQRPQNVNDWRFIYEAIKRTIPENESNTGEK
ncbi:MAG: transcriptional regulator, family [Chthonomonadaceae bacterium]|nr:transcriptional regulator, family [Chthonomonadaceae bacterium]